MPFCVLHIPHSASDIPADARSCLLLSDDALRRQLLLMTDWFTDHLFALSPTLATSVRFPVSRLVVDPERFPDDGQEVMASRGMGVIYTLTSEGERLRESPSSVEREQLLGRFYEPHHFALLQAVDAALAAHNSCLVIDCHSFPSQPLPFELDKSPARPDICVGTDGFHTPAWLVDAARDLFESAGFSVAIDRPFSGALVPAVHLRRNAFVVALMIEVNRRLYMHEGSGDVSVRFPMTAAAVRNLVAELVRLAARRLSHSA